MFLLSWKLTLEILTTASKAYPIQIEPKKASFHIYLAKMSFIANEDRKLQSLAQHLNLMCISIGHCSQSRCHCIFKVQSNKIQ